MCNTASICFDSSNYLEKQLIFVSLLQCCYRLGCVMGSH